LRFWPGAPILPLRSQWRLAPVLSRNPPDEEFWPIPLNKCDSAIDKIDVKSGFITKWSICGGAKSFELSLNPRAVVVSSDHVHCSSTPSEVSVTFVGSPKE
jgi:hypothetical protein